MDAAGRNAVIGSAECSAKSNVVVKGSVRLSPRRTRLRKCQQTKLRLPHQRHHFT